LSVAAEEVVREPESDPVAEPGRRSAPAAAHSQQAAEPVPVRVVLLPQALPVSVPVPDEEPPQSGLARPVSLPHRREQPDFPPGVVPPESLQVLRAPMKLSRSGPVRAVSTKRLKTLQ
jgi:hypothetical protein